ncbi:hypothetical protein [Haladaptatus sp. CMAA 1911]|uniref:DUF7094 domain-containing protein n=1 Tax=unclassified Haladaptatus TaxID=2622732 RepID=UPI003755199E
MSSDLLTDMSRVSRILLAALLVLCSPSVAFGIGVPASTASPPAAKNPVQPPGFNNTSSHLSLGTPTRSDTYSPTMSLSTTLEMDRNELLEQKKRYTLDEQLSKVDDSSKKEQLLIKFRSNIEVQLSELKSEERSASEQFTDQEIGAQKYVQRLALIDSKGKDVERSIEYMISKRKDVIQFPPDEWKLRTDLIPLQSRIRDYAARSFRGEGDSRSLYVAATEDGVVLSMVNGNQYIREAYRPDYRNVSKSSQLSISEVSNLTVNSYPWIVKQSESGTPHSDTDVRYKKGASKTLIYYSQGLTEAYLDTGTEKIYREIQYKLLTGNNHVPYGTAIRNNSTNLELTVNRTYPGGPLRVKLTNSSGEPVQGKIAIGETPVGNTGPSGTMWTVSPRGTYTVRATHSSETVNVTLTPYGIPSTNSTSGSPEEMVGTAQI